MPLPYSSKRYFTISSDSCNVLSAPKCTVSILSNASVLHLHLCKVRTVFWGTTCTGGQANILYSQLTAIGVVHEWELELVLRRHLLGLRPAPGHTLMIRERSNICFQPERLL